MGEIERPDLSQVDPSVRAYIESLEAKLARRTRRDQDEPEASPSFQPSEPPSGFNLITVSHDGLAKRAPRYLYGRQRRGGMGVFDLNTGKEDHPAFLAVVDEEQHMLLFSNFGRAFRLPVNILTEGEVRDQGQPLAALVPFRPHERIVAALPDQGGEYVILASQRGIVRRIRASYLGSSLIPGMSFHDVKEGGYLTAACWTQGDGDLFLATRLGKAIRFAESQVPARGCRGIQVHIDDGLVGVASVQPDGGVFLLGDDGRGTIRLMSGFAANKAPGAGGKIAMKTDRLVGAVTVRDQDDIFVITRQSKIIRFGAAEVPAKTGVVQGVNCISLRGDKAVAVTSCPMDHLT